MRASLGNDDVIHQFTDDGVQERVQIDTWPVISSILKLNRLSVNATEGQSELVEVSSLCSNWRSRGVLEQCDH